MGYPTKHQGPDIDVAIEKGRSLRVVNNGWIRLESSTNAPINLSVLKNPGNYIMSYWTDGPDLDSSNVKPLNITVVYVNGKLYQYANIAGMKYSRHAEYADAEYGNWCIDQEIGSINPGPNPPLNPVNNSTIWLDTSNAKYPILKIFSDGEWIEILPVGALRKNIYDPQGKELDIFQYIEDTVASAHIGESEVDFNQHINDTVIHVTQAEKDRWNTSATPDDVVAATERLKPALDAQVGTVVDECVVEIEALTVATTQLQSTVNAHVNDKTIHPSLEKQAEWDAKCDSEHTHHLDNNVTIDPSNIKGLIPSSILPYDVKERVYEVNSLTEMYALQKNPVHNGDVICVSTKDGDDWYFVINDEYLGTKSSEQAFKKFSGGAIPDVSWNSITGTPTTLAGYGITDAASKTEIVAVQKQIATLEAELPDDIDLSGTANAQSVYNNAVDNLAILDEAMLLLESSVSKLEYMST